MDAYLKISGEAMTAVTTVFDLARAAEKMMDWKCIGQENEAWKTGPYISAPANETPINHSYPYCLLLILQ